MSTAQRRVYVMSTMSYTPLALVIRLVTKKTYAHASLILDDRFREGYAFSRRWLSNPFIGAFVKERYDVYIRKFKNAVCFIGAVEVSQSEYERVREGLESMYAARESYGYNYAGLLLKAFGLNIQKPGSFYCAEFVDHVLKRFDLLETGKASHEVLASDFPENPEIIKVYEGKLTDYIMAIRAREERGQSTASPGAA